MPKQPSFIERRQLLAKAGEELAVMWGELEKIADVVNAEVNAMIAAERRFSERRGKNDHGELASSPPP